MLDLQAGVDLEEGDRAVLADEELAGAGADVAGLARGSPWTRGRARRSASSVRNGAGASSTSFWWRRCSEQSRVETTTTLPCWSARHWVSTCRGLVEVPLDEALAAAERGDRLADRGLEQLGDLLEGAGDLEAAAAAAVGRLDRDRAGRAPRRTRRPRRRPRPGRWCRAPAGRRPSAAMCRALTLSPRLSMAAGGGPIQIRPGVDDGLGEVGVLGEEAVAGVDRVGAGAAAATSRSLSMYEVGVAGGRAAEGVGLVGDLHVQRVAVGVGVDGDDCRSRRPCRPGRRGRRSRRGWR